MANGDTYWSTDGETFNHESLADAIQALIDSGVEPVGADVEYGVAERPCSTDFFSAERVIDSVRDFACDEFGEWAEDYPDVTREAVAELDAFLKAWATKHCEVTFYNIVGITDYVIKAADVAGATRAQAGV